MTEEERAYHRHWHKNASSEFKERKARLAKERIQRNIKFIWTYKASHPCVDCGEADPIVLDFDHLRDKNFNIADAARLGYGVSRIMEEIEKCEIRCANCHRRVTYYRAQGVAQQQSAPFGAGKQQGQHLPP